MAQPDPPPSRPTRRSSGRKPGLAGLRSKIDKIDRSLVALMNERAEVAREIGHLKHSSGQETYDPSREELVLGRVAAANHGPLSDHSLKAIFRELISGSRAIEQHLRVAHLGPAWTYSHLAALHRFGGSVDFVPVGSISAAFEEVHAGHSNYGVVPLENSTDGRIADTLDNFSRLPVKICAEVPLRIHHTLLATCDRSAIREVYSRPQALSQCRNWLARHLPSARLVEVTSTSLAAETAAKTPHAAAIASRQAGVHYGLNVLAEEIEDVAGNTTRFAVIGHSDASRTGNDKTALMFEIEHRPGGLADALAIPKRQKLNLTWIESFPLPGEDRGYIFFVELDGHRADLRVRRAIASLEKRCTRVVCLGSYATAAPVG
ncbi:MAG: prephenate dehydratase [Planctomycetota bacterium]|jgi:chorismate mutase/prephenate dehydratase|nr:prephenate dehydratase [Planctomycetota bacterium]